MDYQRYERMPVWSFGYWEDTLARWKTEGLQPGTTVEEATGLDPDWEAGMWSMRGIVNLGPIANEKDIEIEKTDDYVVVKTGFGSITKRSRSGSSVSHHIEEALKPTRESWARFKKFIDPSDPRRLSAGWEGIAEELNKRDGVATFMGGSLFGWPRDWMGVEAISYLAYDDPALYEEIIEYVADYFMQLFKPVLGRVSMDFVYIFEDCCFKNGPLFSPDIYRKYYDRHYRRLVDFYHGMGVKYVLLDSDGKIDDLIPCWLDSGIDILLPIEVGTWNQSPVELRKRFGKALRMMGGVDKHVIPKGEKAIRAHLETLKPLVAEGGYIPLPDHRIPPDCSLEQFRTYVRVFKSVFGNLSDLRR